MANRSADAQVDGDVAEADIARKTTRRGRSLPSTAGPFSGVQECGMAAGTVTADGWASVLADGVGTTWLQLPALAA